MKPTVDLAEELVGKTLGHTGFKPGQRSGIDMLCQKRNLLFAGATGCGKSLFFQLMAVLLAHCARDQEGVCCVILVLSPYIALSKDQISAAAALAAFGVGACMLSGGKTDDDLRSSRQALAAIASAGCRPLLAAGSHAPLCTIVFITAEVRSVATHAIQHFPAVPVL